MTSSKPPPRCVNIRELSSILEGLTRDEPCDIAFDGDGTLWSGDVSDDVFSAACRTNWVTDEPVSRLMAIARMHEVPIGHSHGELLWNLFEAEKQGRLDERLLFEIMTWCYAGRSVAELSEFSERALANVNIDERIRWEYRHLLDWGRARGHKCWLVTASPWPIVRVVARRLGFDDDDIIAARAAESPTGVIGTDLLAPLPYREQKVLRLQAQRKHERLLASFGDSLFDLDLLLAAELAVAVDPKPALACQLGHFERVVVLVGDPPWR